MVGFRMESRWLTSKSKRSTLRYTVVKKRGWVGKTQVKFVTPAIDFTECTLNKHAGIV